MLITQIAKSQLGKGVKIVLTFKDLFLIDYFLNMTAFSLIGLIRESKFQIMKKPFFLKL